MLSTLGFVRPSLNGFMRSSSRRDDGERVLATSELIAACSFASDVGIHDS